METQLSLKQFRLISVSTPSHEISYGTYLKCANKKVWETKNRFIVYPTCATTLSEIFRKHSSILFLRALWCTRRTGPAGIPSRPGLQCSSVVLHSLFITDFQPFDLAPGDISSAPPSKTNNMGRSSRGAAGYFSDRMTQDPIAG